MNGAPHELNHRHNRFAAAAAAHLEDPENKDPFFISRRGQKLSVLKVCDSMLDCEDMMPAELTASLSFTVPSTYATGAFWLKEFVSLGKIDGGWTDE